MVKRRRHSIVGELRKLIIPGPDFRVAKNRICRVFLPSDYNPQRRQPYRVLYMFDGQNCFDIATSFIGEEWQIDETVERRLQEGYPSMVVVGIYNSRDRNSEYTPRFDFEVEEPFDALDATNIFCRGELTAEYVVKKVIPMVESTFNCGRSPDLRAIGGSSLGGIMTTFMAYKHPECFRDFIAFSTAFHLYKIFFGDDRMFQRVVSTFIDEKHRDKFSYILSAGGHGFEASFLPYVDRMRQELRAGGFDPELFKGLVDPNFSHNEKQWAFYFDKIYPFLTR